jgi:YD repeat-containing protein
MRRSNFLLAGAKFVCKFAATFWVLSAAVVSAQEVIPDFYREPGLYPNRSYVNQGFNEQIDPFTGSLQQHYVDLSIPGNGGFDLKVVRSYNSASVDPLNPAAYESLAGLGWTIHFGRVLKSKETTICLNKNALTVTDNPVLELPDGSRQLLAFTGSTSPLMLTTQRWRADCLGAGTGLSVFSPDGTQYDMTQLVNVGSGVNPVYAWFTTKITDKNGNYANINYASGSTPEITSVTTSDGRSIAFSYADSGLGSRRLTSISGAGQTYSYGYQAVSGVAERYFLTSVTRPGGTTWQYNYNGNLNTAAGSYVMSQTTHPEGGSISYGYSFVYFDSQANPSSRSAVVTSKTRSAGGTWSFSYSPGSLNAYDTTTVGTPTGTVVYRHIGPNYSSSGTVWMVGLLMSKTIGSLQTETYTWGKQKISSENNARPGAFVTKVDLGETNAPVLTQRAISRDGATYTTGYSSFDTYGNPATISESGTSGGTRTTNLTYYVNTSKWIVNQVQNESFTGSSISRSFDANGNLSSITRDGVTTGHTYDGQGNVTSTTFPRSLTHNYSNYKRGIPQTESQPVGVSIARVVSDAGNVTSETNGDGKTTSFGYDGLNRVTSIGYPIGSAVSISFGAASKSATRSTLTESTSYNGFGQATGVTLGGIARSFNVDALGRRTFESDPASASGTSYQYDILNRVTRVNNADGTFSTISYGAGSTVAVDERGKSTTYTYRAYGNPDQQFLMSISAPEASANVSLIRNSRDLVTSATQAGLTRGYGYNANYFLTSVSNPETGTTTYGRDAAGNMTTRVVGASGTTNYAYDGQNRLTSVTYPGVTPGVTNTYNNTHKLLSSNSSGGSRSFAYDANGNLTLESLMVDGITFNTGYAYNNRDQLSSITYPRSGRVVNYAPDALGRPTVVSGFVSNVNYWPSGQIKQINYNNATVSNYNQNVRLWPSSFSTQKTNGSTYSNSSYNYDGVGNLTSISDASDTSYNRTISYDNINRVTGVSGPWGAGSITYDGTGNITSQVLGSSNLYYAYDGANRLSAVSGSRAASYSYDAYGDIVSGSGNTYTYDGAPNLRCVNCTDVLNRIEYVYDATNKRSTVIKAGVKSYEMYDSNDNLLIEFTPSLAGKLVQYVYLGGKRVAQLLSDDRSITATTLESSANPSIYGRSVTFTAYITGGTPTGLVTFKDGATILGTANVAAGVAIYTATGLSLGSHDISASYDGDDNNAASISAVFPQAVVASTTAVVSSANPSKYQYGVTFTAIVTGAAPTGLVTFKDGTTNLGTGTLIAGVAKFETSALTLGDHIISASYDGDGNNDASTSPPISQKVVSASTAQWDKTIPGTIGLGLGYVQALSVRVPEGCTVGCNSSNPNMQGVVRFSDGDIVIANVPVQRLRRHVSDYVEYVNLAYVPWIPSVAGVRVLKAEYLDQSNNVLSSITQSTIVDASLVFAPLATTTEWMSLPPSSSLVNTDVYLTVKVGGNGRILLNCDPNQGFGCNDGSYGVVRFYDGGTLIGEAPANRREYLSFNNGHAIMQDSNIAGIVWTPTSTGTHNISAHYIGVPQNTPSSANASTVVTP